MKSIQQEFHEGIQELWHTMFNDGKTFGVNLYLLSDKIDGGFYKELKVKLYKPPIMLSAKVIMSSRERLSPNEVEHPDTPSFVIPVKEFLDKDVPCDSEDAYDTLRRAYIEFNRSYYKVLNITPKSFVDRSFLFLSFDCEQDLQVEELVIEDDGS